MGFRGWKPILLYLCLLLVVKALFLVPKSVGVSDEPVQVSSLTERQAAMTGDAVSAEVVLQGWSSLDNELERYLKTFQAAISVQAVVQALTALQTSVQTTASRYGQLASDEDISARHEKFQAVLVRFFASFSAILKIVESRYTPQWGTQLAPIFRGCQSAFVALGDISASLELDVIAILLEAHINLKLFLSAGLDLSALMEVHLPVGLAGLYTRGV